MALRRIALVLSCVGIIIVQLFGLFLDFVAALATGPLTDAPRYSGQWVFEVHPILVLISWAVLLFGGLRKRSAWLGALCVGLISPSFVVVLMIF